MIAVNLNKAKAIGHAIRREARASEFAPLDQQVLIAIGDTVRLAEAEAARQVVRDKYAEIQQEIDSAETAETLKSALANVANI